MTDQELWDSFPVSKETRRSSKPELGGTLILVGVMGVSLLVAAAGQPIGVLVFVMTLLML